MLYYCINLHKFILVKKYTCALAREALVNPKMLTSLPVFIKYTCVPFSPYDAFPSHSFCLYF